MVDQPVQEPAQYRDPLDPPAEAAPVAEPPPAAPALREEPHPDRETPAPRTGGWLPTLHQVISALQGDLGHAIGPDPEDVPFVRGTHSSMRQGVGLIVLVGLLSGLWRLLLHWSAIAETGALVPLLRASDGLLRLQGLFAWLDREGLPAAQMRELVGGLAAREPWWLTGKLLSVGPWVNTPLRLLTWWLVYGLLVLLVAKVLGAGTTLPRFYAATAYAVLPLLLTILQPMAWLGPALTLVGWVAAVVLYARAVRVVSGLDWGRTGLSVAAPVLLAAGATFFFVLLLTILTIL